MQVARARRLALYAVTLFGIGCSGSPEPLGALRLAGRALLRGLDRHSGIIVSLVGPASALTATDATGAYRFEGLSPGTYAVLASARSTRERTQTTLVTVGEAAQIAPDIVFEPLGILQGKATLVGRSDSSGVAVFVPAVGVAAVTDASGAFALRDVPIGSHEVRAERAGYRAAVAPAVVVTYDGSTVAPDLLLLAGAGGGAIRGDVHLRGEVSHAGVAVTLAGSSVAARVTSDDGRFDFEGLASGDYVVSASAEHTAERFVSVAVRVADETSMSLAPLELSPVGEVSGRVTLAGATAHDGTFVVLTPAGDSGGAGVAAVTDAAGVYRVRDVSVGAHRLVVTRAGYRSSEPLTIVVRRGEMTEATALELSPTPQPGLGAFEGVVRRVDAFDHAGLRVQIGADGPSALTDAAGRFILEGVPAGLHTLSVRGAPFDEDVPNVLTLPGAGAFFFLDGTLLPFEPVEVARARRVASVGGARAMLVSPDEDAVILFGASIGEAQVGALWLTRAAGGALSRLSTQAMTDTAAFAADGRSLYWLEPIGGDSSVTRLLWARVPDDAAIEASPTPLAEGVSPVVNRSPDGRHLAFESRAGSGQGTLQVVRLGAGELVFLAESARVGDLRWSGAGEHAAFLAGQLRDGIAARLAIVELATGSQRDIATAVGGKMEVSPGGDYLLFVVPTSPPEANGALHVVAFASGEARMLEAQARLPVFFSPDGGRVAFYAGRDLDPDVLDVRAATIASGPAVTLGSVRAPGRGFGSSISFSPTGAHVVFSSTDESRAGLADLYLADVTTPSGARLLVGNGPADPAAAPRFTPDGQRLLFVAEFDVDRGVGVLCLASTTNAGLVDLARDVAPFAFAPTPDGLRAVFVRALDVEAGAADLWLTSLAAPSPVRIATGVRVAVADVAPDFPLTTIGSSTALALGDFDAGAGTGTLRRVDLTTGASTVISPNVAAERFVYREDVRGVLYVTGYDAASETGIFGFSADGASSSIFSAERLALPSWLDLRALPFASDQVLVSGAGSFAAGSSLFAMSLASGALRLLDNGVSIGDARIGAGGRVHWRAFDVATQGATRWRAADLAAARLDATTLLRGVVATETTRAGKGLALRQASPKPLRFQDGLYVDPFAAP